MDTLLEIIKYTVPSLVVFATAYTVLKQYLDQQVRLKSMEVNAANIKDNKAIKLQAYERLTLFLDRIMPQNLYIRLYQKDLTAKELKNSMLMAIQQEYEYNLTQQLYVSPSLWKIIQLAKEQTTEIISQCGDKANHVDPSYALLDKINAVTSQLEVSPIDQAKSALRKELTLIIQ